MAFAATVEQRQSAEREIFWSAFHLPATLGMPVCCRVDYGMNDASRRRQRRWRRQCSQSSLGCTYTLLTSAFSVIWEAPWEEPRRSLCQNSEMCGSVKKANCIHVLFSSEGTIDFCWMYSQMGNLEWMCFIFILSMTKKKQTDWSFCFLLKGTEGVPKTQGCAGMNLLGKVASVQSVSKWQIRGRFLLTELWCIWFGSL